MAKNNLPVIFISLLTIVLVAIAGIFAHDSGNNGDVASGPFIPTPAPVDQDQIEIAEMLKSSDTTTPAITRFIDSIIPGAIQTSAPAPIVAQIQTSSTATSVVAAQPVQAPVEVAAPVTTTTIPFGISVGNTLVFLNKDQLNGELDDIASLGVTWVRLDISWSDIQPSNGLDYQWANMDAIINALNARNMRILVNVAYTPPWARPSTCSTSDKCAPADPALFARFVQTVASRYAKNGVFDWEIWNEPNNQDFWQPAPDPAAYVALLKDTYTAIKQVEPNDTIITGGLASVTTDGSDIAPIDFLQDIYQQGAEPYFTEVGFHPYSFPLTADDTQSWNPWTEMSASSPSLRSVMTANGDADKQIWITEYGAPTGGPDAVSEQQQSTILADYVYAAKNLPWAGPFFWYSYKDLGTDTSTNENFFGLLRYDGSQKPAYTELKSLLSAQ